MTQVETGELDSAAGNPDTQRVEEKTHRMKHKFPTSREGGEYQEHLMDIRQDKTSNSGSGALGVREKKIVNRSHYSN